MKDANDVLNMVEENAVPFEEFEAEETEETSVAPAAFEPFPTDVLPGILAKFVRQAATSIGCDETLVVNPLLAACAGAIGNTRQIVIKKDWREPAILWTTGIANSGDRKSPPFRLVKAFFDKVEQQSQSSYEREESQYKADHACYSAAMKKWSKTGSGCPPEEPKEPNKTRYVINDATTESVAHCLGTNSRGLVLMRDELSGWFNAFGQYKNGDADSPFWLECFEAGTYSVDRRGIKKPVYIPRCSVSVTGTTQPATLQRFLENRVAVENGLFQRFLLAFPPERPTRWTEQEIDPNLTEAVQRLFDSLLSLEFYIDSNEAEHPQNVDLSQGARKLFEGAFNQYGTEKLKLPGDLKSAWSKMPGKIARLALVFHMVRSVTEENISPNRLDTETMQAAIDVGRWFANEASRVYSILGCKSESPEAKERREILDVIKSLGGSATIRQIGQEKRRYRSGDRKEKLEKILRNLVSNGKLHSESKATGGRPTEVFSIAGTEWHGTKVPQNTGNNRLSFRATNCNEENTQIQ